MSIKIIRAHVLKRLQREVVEEYYSYHLDGADLSEFFTKLQAQGKEGGFHYTTEGVSELKLNDLNVPEGILEKLKEDERNPRDRKHGILIKIEKQPA